MRYRVQYIATHIHLLCRGTIVSLWPRRVLSLHGAKTRLWPQPEGLAFRHLHELHRLLRNYTTDTTHQYTVGMFLNFFSSMGSCGLVMFGGNTLPSRDLKAGQLGVDGFNVHAPLSELVRHVSASNVSYAHLERMKVVHGQTVTTRWFWSHCQAMNSPTHVKYFNGQAMDFGQFSWQADSDGCIEQTTLEHLKCR